MMYLVVGAAGLLISLLITPKAGQETREKVKERFNVYKNRFMRKETPNGTGGDEGIASTVQSDYLH
jgi:gas vesicle protein